MKPSIIDKFNYLVTGSLPYNRYEQYVDGTMWNDFKPVSYDYLQTLDKSNMGVVMRHPILTTVTNFVGQLFAQAEFWVEDKNGKRIDKHQVLDALKNPMFSLTTSDFLQAMYVGKVGYGTQVVHKKKKSVGFNDTVLRLLNTDLLHFPTMTYAKYKSDNFVGYKVTYDPKGENTTIPIEELIFIRDLPINLSDIKPNDKNEIDVRARFISESRIQGLRQTLQNTVTSLEAKEVILKTNGKELYSSKSGASDMPLSNEEKGQVESKLNSFYGLQKNRSRAIVVKSALDWKSLHIALRDLGLDESVKTDGNIVYTAFNIPRDVISLDLKKASYQNQKESMAGYIQNEMLPQLKDLLETLNSAFAKELGTYTLKGGYEHLPIMEFIKLQRYDMMKKQADALKGYLDVGIKFEDAIELVGLKKGLTQNNTNES